MALIDLEKLRKDIDEDRKRLAAKEAALRYLEEMSGDAKLVLGTKNTIPENNGIIQLDQLVPDADRRTLIDDVRDVISRFGNQEFSVIHVDAALKQIGREVKGGKFPRSRISTVLAKLESLGETERTFTGGGNVPHRYKSKKLEHVLD